MARYIEEEGISTVLISLVREHTEKIKPPRALWVPFPLGRPMGEPNSPELQSSVLETALHLLDRSDVPVLENFPEERQVTKKEKLNKWLPPVTLPPRASWMGRLSEALAEEISLLKSARNFNNGKTKRTVYGVSGLEINEIATLMRNFIIDQRISSPSKEKSLGQMLKFASDDLKVWYYEAAGKKARTTGKEITDWFWRETAAGETLLNVAFLMRMSNDNGLKSLGSKSIIPRDYNYLIHEKQTLIDG